MKVRVWLVTALSANGDFIDQRRIEALSFAVAQSYAYDWIKTKGGDVIRSTLVELD